jgi:hypothetical protein
LLNDLNLLFKKKFAEWFEFASNYEPFAKAGAAN